MISESALNYIADDDLTRSPSPTKSPFPDITETPDALNNTVEDIKVINGGDAPEEINAGGNDTNGVVNG